MLLVSFFSLSAMGTSAAQESEVYAVRCLKPSALPYVVNLDRKNGKFFWNGEALGLPLLEERLVHLESSAEPRKTDVYFVWDKKHGPQSDDITIALRKHGFIRHTDCEMRKIID